MTKDKITIENIKCISRLSVEFNYPESKFIVITGKNGIGKTSLIKAFHLISDPEIFQKSSGLNAIRHDSKITFNIDGFDAFSFDFNERLGVLDTKDKLPSTNQIIAELPIPFGNRFKQFSLISNHDSAIRANIAASEYNKADELILFLSQIYQNDKFNELKTTKVKNYDFYFILLYDDYYVREDHLSSGEYFLIQLYRIITSGAKLVLIDELDVALDAAAQVKLYTGIKPLLERYSSRLIVISHSLAFMNTVDDGGLYYLEDNAGSITLEQRSFGYIKSDLYGFEGYERYILTEDEVLECFVEYITLFYSIRPYYQYRIIGVGGWNQLKLIVEKNDRCKIFSDSSNVLAILDGDAYDLLDSEYTGATKIYQSPVEDIELFIYKNRGTLLSDIENPTYAESSKPKTASKTYWKYLIGDIGIQKNELYKKIIDSEPEKCQQLADEIKSFLERKN
jgi:ABC-type multidrug transport system ATPase subunit